MRDRPVSFKKQSDGLQVYCIEEPVGYIHDRRPNGWVLVLEEDGTTKAFYCETSEEAKDTAKKVMT